MVLLRIASLLSIVLFLGCDALFAQESATVTGRVTNTAGQPESGVLVWIASLNVAASTGPDGSYRLIIPGSRIRAGQPVAITATGTGLQPQTWYISLAPGDQRVLNFTLAPSVGATPAHVIPTLSEWALLGLLLGLAALGVVVMKH